LWWCSGGKYLLTMSYLSNIKVVVSDRKCIEFLQKIQ